MDILPIISVAIAVISAIIAFKSARAVERSVSHQRASHDLMGFSEFVMRDYINREFRSTEPPIINDTTVAQLRRAKSEAMKAYKLNSAMWDEASQLNQMTWQNKIAFETADALQDLGVAVFTGTIPLHTVSAMAADVIVDDWLLCRSWIKSYRESQHTISQVQNTNTPPVHYHRRHAEWLTLVTIAWIRRHWSYRYCDQVVAWYGGYENIPAQIEALSRADGKLMPKVVKDDIKSLTGIKI